MALINVEPSAVHPGGVLNIKVSAYDGPTGFADIQINLFLVELARDKLVFSMAMQIEVAKEFTITVNVPKQALTGPFYVANLLISLASNSNDEMETINERIEIIDENLKLENISFLIVDGNWKPICGAADMIREFYAKRARRVKTRFEVGELPPTITTQVAYLFTGMLIHTPQHCKGYSILPYSQGLPPTSYHAALNSFTNEFFATTFNLTPQQEREFSTGRPLAAVVFHEIGAQSIDAAMEGTRGLVENIVKAIAFDRGQTPEAFACIVAHGLNLTMWLLGHSYSGNLIPHFGPTHTGAEVERFVRAMEASPFAKLLVELYIQATAEHDAYFRFFRLWSIVELLAKRAVPDVHHHIFGPSGAAIRLSNGQLVTTSKTEARVYKYLFNKGSAGLQASAPTPEGRFILTIGGTVSQSAASHLHLTLTFWDFIQAAYAVRNGVAHEGRFEPGVNAPAGSPQAFAAQLLSCPVPGALLDHFAGIARLAVAREIQTIDEIGEIACDC